MIFISLKLKSFFVCIHKVYIFIMPKISVVFPTFCLRFTACNRHLQIHILMIQNGPGDVRVNLGLIT